MIIKNNQILIEYWYFFENIKKAISIYLIVFFIISENNNN